MCLIRKKAPFNFCTFYSELQEFLQYTTGSPHVHGNRIVVDFIERVEGIAMTVSTCSKTLTISTLVTEYASFTNGLRVLISSTEFTMP